MWIELRSEMRIIFGHKIEIKLEIHGKSRKRLDEKFDAGE